MSDQVRHTEMARISQMGKVLDMVTPRQDASLLVGTNENEKKGDVWIKFTTPWVKSGGGLFRKDECIIDFTGLLSLELSIELAEQGVNIIKGSNADKTWRILVPNKMIKEVEEILQKSNVDSYYPLAIEEN